MECSNTFSLKGNVIFCNKKLQNCSGGGGYVVGVVRCRKTCIQCCSCRKDKKLLFDSIRFWTQRAIALRNTNIFLFTKQNGDVFK